jgi:mycothiol synthase
VALLTVGVDHRGMRDRPDSAILRWRPITPADVPGWHALVERIETADGARDRTGADELGDLLGREWVDGPADTVLGLDDEGVPRAHGTVDLAPGDVSLLRPFCAGGVDPAWRGRGVGRAVLAWQLRRCQDLVARRRVRLGAAVPATALVWVQDAAPGVTAIAARQGFAAARWFATMRRSLDQVVPPVRVPDGIVLAPLTEDLDEQARTVFNAAFTDHWGSQPLTAADWRATHVGGPVFRRPWSLVALAGDDLVGLHLASAYEHEWTVHGETQGWTEALGVAAAWRGRGLATALLTAALQLFARDGMQSAALGVDSDNPSGAVHLYTRLGYLRSHGGAVWTRAL